MQQLIYIQITRGVAPRDHVMKLYRAYSATLKDPAIIKSINETATVTDLNPEEFTLLLRTETGTEQCVQPRGLLLDSSRPPGGPPGPRTLRRGGPGRSAG